MFAHSYRCVMWFYFLEFLEKEIIGIPCSAVICGHCLLVNVVDGVCLFKCWVAFLSQHSVQVIWSLLVVICNRVITQ